MFSQKFWGLGLVPDGGKELTQASKSSCLKICTGFIGYALLTISSFFVTEELRFEQKHWDSIFVFKNVIPLTNKCVLAFVYPML